MGLLGPEAGEVVAFTNMITGIDLDLCGVAKGQLEKLAVADRIRIFESDLAVWNRAKLLGQRLVKKLQYRNWTDTVREWVTGRGS